jgi:hypothetical protein
MQARALLALIGVALPAEARATCNPGGSREVLVDVRTGSVTEAKGSVTAPLPFSCPLELLDSTVQPPTKLPGQLISISRADGRLFAMMVDPATDRYTMFAIDGTSNAVLWSLPNIVAGYQLGVCHDFGAGRIGFETTAGLHVVDAATGVRVLPLVKIDTKRVLWLQPHAGGWIVQSRNQLVRLNKGGKVMWRRTVPADLPPAAIVGGDVTVVVNARTLHTHAAGTGKLVRTTQIAWPKQTDMRILGRGAIVGVTGDQVRLRVGDWVCGH